MITTISNSFSFSRLMMVMKRDLVDNWKNNLRIALSIYGTYVICALMSYATTSDMVDSSLYFAYRLGFYMSTTCITFIIFFINAGHIMDVFGTKEKRISFLMLPATQAEKFVSRALYVTLGTFVMVVVALFLAEITRLMLFPLLGAPEVLQQFCLFDLGDIVFKGSFLFGIEYIQDETVKCLAILAVFSNLIFVHSVFILGGTYFYKQPISKTFGLIVLGSVIVGFTKGFFGFRSFIMNIDQTTQQITSIIVYLGLAACCWALSYFLFTRSQVTKRVNFKFLRRG